MAIPRKPPTASLAQWEAEKPTMHQARSHVQRVLACVPEGWRMALRERVDDALPAVLHRALSDAEHLQQQPEFAQAWDLMQAVADYEREFGDATIWNLDDWQICDMAKKLAAQADELEALDLAMGAELPQRVDSIRMLVRVVGVHEDKPIVGAPAIKRAQDPMWWRRRLRVFVARTMEGAAVRQALVHKASGAYVSAAGLWRDQKKIERNAAMAARTVFRNEAGQVWRLDELSALGTSNPVVRGGELMTRIRGAEEYADARAHVGLFLTLTTPSRFHPVKLGNGRRPFRNKNYDSSLTPRHSQAWLCKCWQRVRSALGRKGIKLYGLRVAEPHHDATPHWHMLVWVETEAQAQLVEDVVRDYWLQDAGDERGARENRVNFKRMTKGGAAGYVAKYITKSVGHMALLEHQDVVDGQQLRMDFGPTEPSDCREPGDDAPLVYGHQRVGAWARTWGIRQFQTFGMPSVTVWRELRRVTKDQLELFTYEGDRATVRAHQACHRHGALRANWCLFMESMGGHARKRCDWHMRIWRRENIDHKPNLYGEVKPFTKVVGLQVQMGRLHGQTLVSRRMDWFPVAGDEAQAALSDMQQCQDEGVPFRQALPAAWTCFNNCTARLNGTLHREVFGRGDHHHHYAEDWLTPETVRHFRALRGLAGGNG